MSTINTRKIGHGDSLAPNATHTFGWNNPPTGRVISYVAYPVVAAPGGGKFADTNGAISVTRVTFVINDSNEDGYSYTAQIEILNSGGMACGWDLYENWID